MTLSVVTAASSISSSGQSNVSSAMPACLMCSTLAPSMSMWIDGSRSGRVRGCKCAFGSVGSKLVAIEPVADEMRTAADSPVGDS